MESSQATPPGVPPEAEAATEPAIPQVPHVDHTPETPEEVQALADSFAAFRKEVADLRREMQLNRRPGLTISAPVESIEDRTKARVAEIAQHSYYCPGCGRLYDYQRECTGTLAAPHKPIEVVSTDELAGDPANHTAAPATDEAA
jgi:hypothetical protein